MGRHTPLARLQCSLDDLTGPPFSQLRTAKHHPSQPVKNMRLTSWFAKQINQVDRISPLALATTVWWSRPPRTFVHHQSDPFFR